ncbi:MAG TPA: HAMP domain-containing histidine kinase [bacterium]|nr:HAMP domain-containing histidine kinase [bacterium]
MIMYKTKTKKFKVFLLSLVIVLMTLTAGFFAYTAYTFGSLYAKTSAFYSLKQSNMIFFGGQKGLRLVYPSMSGGSNGVSFYFVFTMALLLFAGIIIFMFVYFYRLIESQENTELTLRSVEKNILEVPSTIIHEIKGNINSVLINSRVLIEKVKDIESNKDGIVKTGGVIGSETARLAQTMDNILKFTKDYDLNLENVSLSELIEEAYELIENRVSAKGIVFSVSVDRDINIKMDKDLMLQVFKNLILNAVESYKSKKGEVSVYSSYILNKISLVVEDNGAGIDKKYMRKIFEPFFTTKKTGVGLGLALTKNIIDAHGFNINVDSHNGVGTKISVIMKDL